MKKYVVSCCISLICILFVLTITGYAQIPQKINYQGVLADSFGIPINGTVQMTFAIYDVAAGGVPLWSETRDVNIDNGKYSLILGEIEPISPSEAKPYWLGITVEDDAEMTPRMEMTSVMYTLFGATGPQGEPGPPGEGLPLGCTEGQIAEWNGSEWVCSSMSTGFGWSLTGNANTSPGINFLGTTDNRALELKVNNTRVLRLEPGPTFPVASPNIIVGHNSNSVDAGVVGATISGGGEPGYPNTVNSHYGVVGGGRNNTAANTYATIGGGVENTANQYATVGGGNSNEAQGRAATIGGGGRIPGNPDSDGNIASGDASTIGGGTKNTAAEVATTISGGFSNVAGSWYATVSGGAANSAEDSLSTVGGGFSNTASGSASTVSGGSENTAEGGSSTISGGYGNAASGEHSTIGGGEDNAASGERSTISGGYGNVTQGRAATIAGGGYYIDEEPFSGPHGNTANGDFSTVSGGIDNDALGESSTIGGGYGNIAAGNSATIGGGTSNITSDRSATINGGENNAASDRCATVGGGRTTSLQARTPPLAGERAMTLQALPLLCLGGGTMRLLVVTVSLPDAERRRIMMDVLSGVTLLLPIPSNVTMITDLSSVPAAGCICIQTVV